MKLVIDLGTKATGASAMQRSEGIVARILAFIAMLLGAEAQVYPLTHRGAFVKDGEGIAGFSLDTVGDESFTHGDVEQRFYGETGTQLLRMPEGFLNPIGESEARMIAVALDAYEVAHDDDYDMEWKRRQTLLGLFDFVLRRAQEADAAGEPPRYYSLVPTHPITVPERSPAAT